MNRNLLLFALCSLPALAGASSITLTGTVRDFNSYGTTYNGVAGQVDFENRVSGETGIVQTALGADGKPVYNATTSHGTVNSAASFYQWYHDDPSVNRTGGVSITLNETSTGSGLYQFSSNNFFPIDGQLLGQTSDGHNFGFTTEFHTTFGYNAGRSDTFSFSGDDDVFVFINGKLAIDLGGVHGSESGSVNLDAIAASYGLTGGNNYTLDVFQAERHTTGSNFTMTTSLDLVTSNPVPEPATLGLLLAGLGLGALRNRRSH